MDEISLSYAQATAKMLSAKWRLLILGKIQENILRPGELQRSIRGISKKVLSYEIQALIKSEMVSRREIVGRVRHVEYNLTRKGHSLLALASAVAKWGKNYPELFATLHPVDRKLL